MFNNRRGQAAMEFLMTYGWAILAAIIAIGVLAYFGVFNAETFIPTATVISAPLYAEAWNVQATGNNVSIEIRNNGGSTITVTEFTLSGAQSPSGTDITCPASAGLGLSVGPGDTQVLSLSCTTPNLEIGKTFKADVAVKYTKTAGGLELTSTGTISDTVV